MANESEKAWGRFEDDIEGLAGELKRHFRSGDPENSAELNRSLEQLRQAADAVFKSLAETFREVSDELEKAVRRRADRK